MSFGLLINTPGFSFSGSVENKLTIVRETVSCGVVHADKSISNLLWDKESRKW